ncbi:MAG: ribonuclease III [Cyanobacteria bacterium J083]|nr:MAG: ribonuclease III [Cyanobacteria bacterium J083]
MPLDSRRKKQLKKFLTKLGLTEQAQVNWSLLDLALTHPSISTSANYEQLEFLGDAVIRLITAEVLLETYPQESVGEFAALRSVMVSDKTLAQLAENFGLEQYLLMSETIAKDPGSKTSRLADSMEAVLGALYLSSQNMRLIRPWLDQFLHKKATEIRQDPARCNYKDALQEWSQAQYKTLPHYEVQENKVRKDYRDRFIARVFLNNRLLGEGCGPSKKAAQQVAAQQALLSLNYLKKNL